MPDLHTKYRYQQPSGAGTITWDREGRLVLPRPLEGSVLRYDDPTEPAVSPETWEATRE